MKKFIILTLMILPIKCYSADQNQVNKITKNLRCLICQGQSIYDSQSEFANSLKKVVEEKINEKNTEKQIYEYLIEKYGEWILYEPQFNKNTYFLWLFPLAIFIFGGILIFRKKFKIY
tara:strand:+ start:126 stop:479 length:354 start_codon:yes stop_codon:yes gene_type:complete